MSRYDPQNPKLGDLVCVDDNGAESGVIIIVRQPRVNSDGDCARVTIRTLDGATLTLPATSFLCLLSKVLQTEAAAAKQRSAYETLRSRQVEGNLVEFLLAAA